MAFDFCSFCLMTAIVAMDNWKEKRFGEGEREREQIDGQRGGLEKNKKRVRKKSFIILLALAAIIWLLLSKCMCVCVCEWVCQRNHYGTGAVSSILELAFLPATSCWMCSVQHKCICVCLAIIVFSHARQVFRPIKSRLVLFFCLSLFLALCLNLLRHDDLSLDCYRRGWSNEWTIER